ncbi:MAG: hypothetical protein JWM43_3907 [Acidobacteriaceae bacterium]|nr:hypothetical protein [Acidobacteriaceae bacterium]
MTNYTTADGAAVTFTPKPTPTPDPALVHRVDELDGYVAQLMDYCGTQIGELKSRMELLESSCQPIEPTLPPLPLASLPHHGTPEPKPTERRQSAPQRQWIAASNGRSGILKPASKATDGLHTQTKKRNS